MAEPVSPLPREREQGTREREWARVDSWLAELRPPRSLVEASYERNEDTLSALLRLADWVEATNERRELLIELKQNVLHEAPCFSYEDVQETMLEAMPRAGREGFADLARTSLVLNGRVDAEEMAEEIVARGHDLAALEHGLRRLDGANEGLQSDLDHLRTLLKEIQSEPAYHPPDAPAGLQRKTTALQNRLDKSLARLSALGPRENNEDGKDDHGLPEVRAHELKTESYISQVKQLESRVAAYHGLPMDPRQAKEELQRAVKERDRLRRKRDGLFEGLVE